MYPDNQGTTPRLRIVDANCGVGPWGWRDPLMPSDPADTLALMDQCGIAAALVHSNLVHTPASAADVNAATLRAVAGCPRFIPAFVLAPHPYADKPQPADYAQAMQRAGVRAAWLRPGSQQHGVWPWLLAELLTMCTAHRLPLFLPADNVTPGDVHALCADFPDLRLILTNLGYRADVWLYPLLRQHAELRVCLGQTYVPPLAPERFVRHFGAERMIFGSGLPHLAPGGLIGMVTYARLPEADQARILAGNLEQLLQEVRW